MAAQAGTAVWVTGPGAPVPCGARVLADAGNGRHWLDVCILGQHLPQMYPPDGYQPLAAGDCARLGLCPDCLGFGDLDQEPAADMIAAARGVDQLGKPCPGCGGSGRPAIRCTVTRTAGDVTGEVRPLPHAYVPPLPGPLDPAAEAMMALTGFGADGCLACGMPPGGLGPRDEVLHPEGAC